jgi:gliding motility-associated lipoprotein GldD
MKIQKHKILIFLLVIGAAFASCTVEEYSPKPRGYYKVDLPKGDYISYNEAGFPYTFEYPSFGKVIKDSVFFDKSPENPYWVNIEVGSLGAKIYLTYKTISDRRDLELKINDAYKMTNAHDKKADYIDDPTFHTPNNVHGVFFEVGGNAASALQFFATDSNKHFLRGALYFNVTPNADSLAPANQFMRERVQHLIKTLKWTR